MFSQMLDCGVILKLHLIISLIDSANSLKTVIYNTGRSAHHILATRRDFIYQCHEFAFIFCDNISSQNHFSVIIRSKCLTVVPQGGDTPFYSS